MSVPPVGTFSPRHSPTGTNPHVRLAGGPDLHPDTLQTRQVMPPLLVPTAPARAIVASPVDDCGFEQRHIPAARVPIQHTSQELSIASAPVGPPLTDHEFGLLNQLLTGKTVCVSVETLPDGTRLANLREGDPGQHPRLVAALNLTEKDQPVRIQVSSKSHDLDLRCEQVRSSAEWNTKLAPGLTQTFRSFVGRFVEHLSKTSITLDELGLRKGECWPPSQSSLSMLVQTLASHRDTQGRRVRQVLDQRAVTAATVHLLSPDEFTDLLSKLIDEGLFLTVDAMRWIKPLFNARVIRKMPGYGTVAASALRAFFNGGVTKQSQPTGIGQPWPSDLTGTVQRTPKGEKYVPDLPATAQMLREFEDYALNKEHLVPEAIQFLRRLNDTYSAIDFQPSPSEVMRFIPWQRRLSGLASQSTVHGNSPFDKPRTMRLEALGIKSTRVHVHRGLSKFLHDNYGHQHKPPEIADLKSRTDRMAVYRFSGVLQDRVDQQEMTPEKAHELESILLRLAINLQDQPLWNAVDEEQLNQLPPAVAKTARQHLDADRAQFEAGTRDSVLRTLATLTVPVQQFIADDQATRPKELDEVLVHLHGARWYQQVPRDYRSPLRDNRALQDLVTAISVQWEPPIAAAFGRLIHWSDVCWQPFQGSAFIQALRTARDAGDEGLDNAMQNLRHCLRIEGDEFERRVVAQVSSWDSLEEVLAGDEDSVPLLVDNEERRQRVGEALARHPAQQVKSALQSLGMWMRFIETSSDQMAANPFYNPVELALRSHDTPQALIDAYPALRAFATGLTLTAFEVLFEHAHPLRQADRDADESERRDTQLRAVPDDDISMPDEEDAQQLMPPPLAPAEHKAKARVEVEDAQQVMPPSSVPTAPALAIVASQVDGCDFEQRHIPAARVPIQHTSQELSIASAPVGPPLTDQEFGLLTQVINGETVCVSVAKLPDGTRLAILREGDPQHPRLVAALNLTEEDQPVRIQVWSKSHDLDVRCEEVRGAPEWYNELKSHLGESGRYYVQRFIDHLAMKSVTLADLGLDKAEMWPPSHSSLSMFVQSLASDRDDQGRKVREILERHATSAASVHLLSPENLRDLLSKLIDEGLLLTIHAMRWLPPRYNAGHIRKMPGYGSVVDTALRAFFNGGVTKQSQPTGIGQPWPSDLTGTVQRTPRGEKYVPDLPATEQMLRQFEDYAKNRADLQGPANQFLRRLNDTYSAIDFRPSPSEVMRFIPWQKLLAGFALKNTTSDNSPFSKLRTMRLDALGLNALQRTNLHRGLSKFLHDNYAHQDKPPEIADLKSRTDRMAVYRFSGVLQGRVDQQEMTPEKAHELESIFLRLAINLQDQPLWNAVDEEQLNQLPPAVAKTARQHLDADRAQFEAGTRDSVLRTLATLTVPVQQFIADDQATRPKELDEVLVHLHGARWYQQVPRDYRSPLRDNRALQDLVTAISVQWAPLTEAAFGRLIHMSDICWEPHEESSALIQALSMARDAGETGLKKAMKHLQDRLGIKGDPIERRVVAQVSDWDSLAEVLDSDMFGPRLVDNEERRQRVGEALPKHAAQQAKSALQHLGLWMRFVEMSSDQMVANPFSNPVEHELRSHSTPEAFLDAVRARMSQGTLEFADDWTWAAFKILHEHAEPLRQAKRDAENAKEASSVTGSDEPIALDNLHDRYLDYIKHSKLLLT